MGVFSETQVLEKQMKILGFENNYEKDEMMVQAIQKVMDIKKLKSTLESERQEARQMRADWSVD